MTISASDTNIWQTELSDYFYPIKSIPDIYRNYQHSNRGVFSFNTPIHDEISKKMINEKVVM